MNDTPPTPLPDKDYEAIESAVMETARGRWFLAEYAKRNRSADTRVLLDAIGRLETVVKRERSIDDVDSLRLELIDMKTAIERTKQEVADLRVDGGESEYVTEATAELDAIVEQTEKATQDILSSAETIQEIAWTLRESNAESTHCDTLDTHATDIYMACSFQDLTGQRTKKVIDVLRYLENHINRMIDIWGFEDINAEFDRPVRADTRPDAHLLNGPQLNGQGIDQSDVDELFGTNVVESAAAEKAEIVDVDIDWNEADVFAAEAADAPAAIGNDAADADLESWATDVADGFRQSDPDPPTPDAATAVFTADPAIAADGEPPSADVADIVTEAEPAVIESAGAAESDEDSPSADWYDEQLAEIVRDEPDAVADDGSSASAEMAADTDRNADDDDPTAHLTTGERLALFS